MSSPVTSRPDCNSYLTPTAIHIHQPIPISPSKCIQLEPSFICTICWQPQYPPADQSTSTSRFGPKVLGSSARIVCQACWCAVLDLSICWVCGECIVRGDEVISLGWCFWHRACFGCLICGTHLTPPVLDDDVSRKRKWKSFDGGDDDVEESNKPKWYPGIELEEIPLCVVCDSEDGHECQGALLANALEETVTHDDGRSSPNHAECLSRHPAELKVIPRQLARRPRRMKGATGIESELGRFINRSSTTSRNASETCFIEDRTPLLLLVPYLGISEDGNSDPRPSDLIEQIDDHTKPAQDQPTVYVSVFDPIGDTPFVPSPTKPLPIWMSVLPNNTQSERGGDREQQKKQLQDMTPESKLSQAFIREDRSNQPSISESTESSGSYDEIRTVHGVTPSSRRSTQSRPTSPIDIPRPKKRATTSISFNRDDYKPHPRAARRSHTMNSTFNTPPEFSTKPPQFRQHPTPFPRAKKSVHEHEEATSYFEHSVEILSMVAHSPGVVAGVLSLSELDHRMCGSFKQSPLLSPGVPAPSRMASEYLDRNKTQAPISLYQEHIAKDAAPAMGKLKRQRTDRRSKKEISVVQHMGSKSIGTLQTDGAGLDLKYQELKNELGDLFCEK